MKNRKKTHGKRKGPSTRKDPSFTVIDNHTNQRMEVYHYRELNNYNLSNNLSFISKNEDYLKKLEDAEKNFDRRYDKEYSRKL